jgi:hypothetical protein
MRTGPPQGALEASYTIVGLAGKVRVLIVARRVDK